MAFSSEAKNPASSISVKGFGEDMVIFNKPSKMRKTKASSAVSDMSVDFTFTKYNDSVAVKSTHITSLPLQMDSVTIISDNYLAKYPLEKLFVEPDGNRWKTRLCFYMSRHELIEMVSAEIPPIFTFGQTGNIAYCDMEKQWKMRKEILELMLEIIELNNE